MTLWDNFNNNMWKCWRERESRGGEVDSNSNLCVHTMETVLMDFTKVLKCTETIYYDEGNAV
jgi:hypothetical protein